MNRGVLAGALVGVVQGLVAVLLVATLGTGSADFGWFAHTPLQPGDSVVLPGPPVVVREWLLVPLVLAVLGALAVALARRHRGAPPAPGRRAVVPGVAGVVLAVVTLALAPAPGAAGTTVLLGGPSPMPRRYSDVVALEAGTSTSAVLVLVVGSVLAAAVLVAVVAAAAGRRAGVLATVAALVLGGAGLAAQLLLTGASLPALLGQVLALALVGTALLVARPRRAHG